MALIGDSAWLQNSVYKEPDPVEKPEETNNIRGSTSHQRSNSEVFEWGHDRKITDTGSTISLKILYATREDKEKTHFGLSKTELFHTSRTFQDGRSPSSTRVTRKR